MATEPVEITAMRRALGARLAAFRKVAGLQGDRIAAVEQISLNRYGLDLRFDLAIRTAVNLGVDLDQISFTVVLALTRAASGQPIPSAPAARRSTWKCKVPGWSSCTSTGAYLASAMVRDRGYDLAIFCKARPVRNTTGRFR